MGAFEAPTHDTQREEGPKANDEWTGMGPPRRKLRWSLAQRLHDSWKGANGPVMMYQQKMRQRQERLMGSGEYATGDVVFLCQSDPTVLPGPGVELAMQQEGPYRIVGPGEDPQTFLVRPLGAKETGAAQLVTIKQFEPKGAWVVMDEC